MHNAIRHLIRPFLPKHGFFLLMLSAMLAAAACPVAAGTWYVATNGDNSAGTSWQTAYTNLQTVLNNARTNDTIYVAGHTFSSAGTVQWTNTLAPNLSLLGGYAATNNADQPGPNNPDLWATVLRPANTGRVIFVASVSNALLRGVTIRDGFYNGTLTNAMGMLVTNCQNLTIDSCTFTSNRTYSTSITRGAALFIDRSNILLTNCLFTANTVGGTVNANGYGYGGAIYMNSGIMTMSFCRVTSNTADSTGTATGYGGGLYMMAASTNVLIRTIISCNQSLGSKTTTGGGITSFGNISLLNCLIDHNDTESDLGDGIYVGGGSLSLANCTVADNSGVGILRDAGMASLSNSIVWGHSDDLKGFPSDGQLPPTLTNVWYSCIQNGDNIGRQGCFSIDPLFANTNFYHLQSKQGIYSNGYFTGGTWSVSPSNSPCIDLGNPVADYSREPAPNGGRINLGAYAGTEVASLSDTTTVFTVPAITNLGWMLAGHRTVTVMAQVTDAGAQTPQCNFGFWIGAGPTSTISAGPKSSAFTLDVSGLTPGSSYQYAASASNAAGIAWSGTGTFATQPVPASFYAATNGNNLTGTSWSSAYTNLQGALNLLEPGDTLYLAGQTFALTPGYQQTNIWGWSGGHDVTLIGGYQASGDADLPGTNNPARWPTLLTRASGNSRILFLSQLTNVTFRNITLSGGYSDTSFDGLGLYATKCSQLTFDACNLVSNKTVTAGTYHGAGAYLETSTISFTNCLVSSNSIVCANNAFTYGAGLYLASGTTTFSRCYITGNSASGNYANYAGGISIEATAVATLRHCVISRNSTTGKYAYGGGLCNAGQLVMENCLVDHNNSSLDAGDGIYSLGTTRLVNCTIANNYGDGIYCTNATVAITNSILWTNTDDIVITGSGTALVAYCNIQTPDSFWTNGVNGCFSTDPLFADSTTYHEQSSGGYYVNGYFNGGSWINAPGKLLSPCINAGNPASDYTQEPDPNGKRINLGAYGNTSVASKDSAAPGTLLMIN